MSTVTKCAPIICHRAANRYNTAPKRFRISFQAAIGTAQEKSVNPWIPNDSSRGWENCCVPDNSVLFAGLIFFLSCTDYYPLETDFENPKTIPNYEKHFQKVSTFPQKFVKFTELPSTFCKSFHASKQMFPQCPQNCGKFLNITVTTKTRDQMPDWPSHLPDDPGSQDRTFFQPP